MPDEKAVPQSRFLPADRTDPATLAFEISRAVGSPVVTALLEASRAAAAVVDANRQVVAVNAAYLATLGVSDPADALGLRPGEALRCIHVEGVASGCGTTTACASCGAALAMLAAMKHGGPAERRCAVALRRGGIQLERDFRARVVPLPIDGSPFLLLTLEDVSAEARRAMLERSFLHDLSNLVVALQSAAGELAPPGEGAAAEEVRQLTDQLAQQVRLQRFLASGEELALERLARIPVEVSDALAVLRRAMEREPAMAGRAVEWPRVTTGLLVTVDPALLHHVLLAMTVNALEAVPAGARVRVEVIPAREHVCLRVWNEGTIPAAIVPRIFQRYFSTKPEPGRGHGTWAMKTLGEKALGGTVSFDTSEAGGTWFQLTLPRVPDPLRAWPEEARGSTPRGLSPGRKGALAA